MKGIITDIVRASVVDGPGIRTVVFLKGCPLHCIWCHNPECLNPKPEMLYDPEKCIHCGNCAEGCYSGAKVLCGKEIEAEEIVEEISLDCRYYGKEGGVTFSGGEPLMQPDFLRELLEACKKRKIRTALETSLYFYDEDIFEKTDLVMADLKIWDSEKHKQYTGIPNEIILKNFRKLDQLDIPIIARTPIIPGINEDAANVKNTAQFLKHCRNVIKYELLPYHPLGISKGRALGKKMQEFQIPEKAKMKELKKYADITGQTE